MNRFIEILAENPKLFNFLRKILENNFKNQKKIISKFSFSETAENILDIGCGTGEFSVFFPPHAYTGIDIEKKYIDYASKNYEGTFLVADATRLSFSNQSFEKIIINSVLHHLSDEECSSVFKEANRVLKDEGKILIIDADAQGAGFLSRLFYRFDRGKFIRTEKEYQKLSASKFLIIDRIIFRDGIYSRLAFICSKR